MAQAQSQPQVDLTQALNELANRLRVLEGRSGVFSERILIVNQNMIDEHEKTMKELKKVRTNIDNLIDDLANVKNIVKHLTDEASKFARDQDVKYLLKYVEFWNPIRFTTEEDVIRIIEKVVAKKSVKKHIPKHKVYEETKETNLEDLDSLKETLSGGKKDAE